MECFCLPLDVPVLVRLFAFGVFLLPRSKSRATKQIGVTLIMSKDGEDPVGGLSGRADDGDDADTNASPAAVAQRMSGIGTTTRTDAVGPASNGGSGMPPSHPATVPQSVPSSIPPGRSLMTAVEWSPIVGKDTVMEEDASKVPPLPPNLSPADLTAQPQQNGAVGAASDGSTGLDIDQVLGLVDDLPDPASIPEPTPVGSLMSTAGIAPPTSASVSNGGAVGGSSAASKASSGVSYPTTAGLGSSASKTASTSASAASTTTTAAAASTAAAPGESESGDRRQRRLERNRESARASRRRRKVYLEELEEKVVCLSEEMDQGRRDHVRQALGTVMKLRMDRLKEVERDLGLDLARLQIGGDSVDDDAVGARHNTRSSNRSDNSNSSMNPALEHHVRALDTYLSRTSDELRLAEIFRKQQLLSLSLPQYRKFVLWLTIQNDFFYRGGRAASERLSAARIGERMLQNGIDRAPPSGDMWPLFCNDVGLSYDQEEKIRAHQRALLMESGPWLHRHTAAAADATIEGASRAVNSAAEMTQGRERSALGVLTIEQRAKFQAWAASRKDRIGRLARAKARAASSMAETSNERLQQGVVGLQTSPDRCDAANLYIVNDRINRICSTMPPAPTLIKPTNLKKLGRRASFESLGSSMANLEGGGKKGGISREKSFPSTGSLKRSAASMSDDSLASKAQKDGPAPEAAEAASAHLVATALNEVRDIIPKAPPREFINISPPHPARGKPPSQRQSYARQQQQPQQQQQGRQEFLHQGGYARATPPAYNPGSPIGLPLSPSQEPSPAAVTSGAGGIDEDMMLPDGRPVPLPIPVHSMEGAEPSQVDSVSDYFVESSHSRVPSFLPQHMNILPEEGFLNGVGVGVGGDGSDPTDMLFDLNEEDWALGLDMEG